MYLPTRWMSEYDQKPAIQCAYYLCASTAANRQLPARRRPLAQCKTATEAAVSVGRVVTVYAFLRLATPTRPSRPEPKSHAAAGTGIALISASKEVTPDPEWEIAATIVSE